MSDCSLYHPDCLNFMRLASLLVQEEQIRLCPSVYQYGGMRCAMALEQLSPSAKKPRSMGTWPHNSVNHKDWLCAAMGLESLPNYLQQLYPHPQDDVCILDEVDHV